MKYFSDEIMYDDEKFLSTYQSLFHVVPRRRALLQYCLVNHNLPRKILEPRFDEWKENHKGPLPVSGAFYVCMDGLSFRVHYDYNRGVDNLRLCVVDVDGPYEYINEFVNDMARESRRYSRKS